MALYGPDSLWTESWQEWFQREYPFKPLPTDPEEIEKIKEYLRFLREEEERDRKWDAKEREWREDEYRRRYLPATPTPVVTVPETDPTPIATVPETEGSINQMLPNRGSSFNRQRLADSVAAKGATSFPTPKTKKGGMNWKAAMEAFAEQFEPEEGPSAAPGRPGPGRRPGSFKPTLAATGQGFPTGIHDMLRKKLMRGLS
jgi:hypothetical protein